MATPLTLVQLEELKSSKGGYTKKVLLSLGVKWPPKKGWKTRLLKQGAGPAITAKPKQAKKKKKRQEKKDRARIRAAERRLTGVGDVNSKEFLNSYAWRKLRMVVLVKYGAVCQCCGRSRVDGVQIHVDHIKPRRKYPELALVESNLQVLCHECNHGKGNWDETDWREPRLSVIMGESIA